MIDFHKINQGLLPNLLSYASSWLPNGKRIGQNYIALNPRRSDRKLGSFVLKLSNGTWRDYATGDSGGDIVSYYAYINNLSQIKAAQALSDYNGFSSYRGIGNSLGKYSKPSTINNDTTISLVKKIWKNSFPITETLAEKYLANRGIILSLPGTLRYHPALWHSPSKQQLPCMVAAITKWPNKDLIGIHRTFLDPAGKGKTLFKPNKMMLGQVNGGAVRLSPVSNDLIVAEGIETALSLLCADPQACVWAALSASAFNNLVLPSSCQNVLIAADNDPTGLQAAMRVSKRWISEGRRVKIAIPPKGNDMNDLLQGGIV